MLLVALREGSAKCSNICPYYADNCVVRGMHGVALATHCRATMQDVIVDCDKYDPRWIEKIEVSEAEWERMQSAIHRRARKLKKEYPEDHAEIHPVGYNWKHERSANTDPEIDPKGKWNAEKSKNARIVADRRTVDGRKKRLIINS